MSSAHRGAPQEERIMRVAAQRIRTIDLDHDQVLILEGGHGDLVSVLSGRAWLTAEGDTADTILCAGGAWPLRRGRTVIEGLDPARVQITAAAARVAPWAYLWRAIRRHVARLQFGPEVVERPT
jgi:hypothetical protein